MILRYFLMSRLNQLVLNPITKKQTDYFLQKPSQALLIVGEAGSGKQKIAYSLAASLLELNNEKELISHPYFSLVKKTTNRQDISIDDVRAITKFLKLKVPGNHQISRIVLIENVPDMSIEAQNAFLKILEEPDNHTIFIATTLHETNLLPTIVSRCQILRVHPLGSDQIKTLFRGYSDKEILSSWQLSAGNADLMESLLESDKQQPLKQAIVHAKTFLKSDTYKRMLFLNDLMKKDKDEVLIFFEGLSKILGALHHVAITNSNTSQSKKLLDGRELVIKIRSAIESNSNLKLTCLQLLVNLKV